MWDEKKLFANADFFHTSIFLYGNTNEIIYSYFCNVSRVRWTAHCMEQRANNRIIRPSADYTGPESSEWIDIEHR